METPAAEPPAAESSTAVEPTNGEPDPKPAEPKPEAVVPSGPQDKANGQESALPIPAPDSDKQPHAPE